VEQEPHKFVENKAEILPENQKITGKASYFYLSGIAACLIHKNPLRSR
jgi:hypothetical protein